MDLSEDPGMRAIPMVGATLVLSLAASAAEPPTAEQLAALDAAVRGYVERDETVSAELLVLVGGKELLHATYGFADREAKRPLERDQIHCIRSMTKTLVGTAAQILIDEGTVGLDDPAGKWLPAFADERHAAITVRHLLEHTSGLGLSVLVGHDVRTIRSLDEIVTLAAAEELVSTPGSEFHYSDNGADVLAAIVAKAAGRPADAFIRERILDPLGMSATSGQTPAERARCVSGYVGAKGAWMRFWSPEDPPVFQCFLGSQSAWSTVSDYAKLLALWQHDGMVGERRLLSHAAIERGLTLAHRTSVVERGVIEGYGQLWSVENEGDGASARRVAFGHGGSDGTVGWCFPERDLLVLFFTQSRGGTSILSFEQTLGQVLFGREPPRRDAAELEGWWWAEGEDHPGRIVRRDGTPTLEIPGRFALTMKPLEGVDRWGFDLDPASTVTLERDAVGSVVALHVRSRDAEQRWPRHRPAASLPSLADVVAKVRAAHGIGADGLPFPIEREATLEMPTVKRRVAIRQEFDGVRSRMESAAGAAVTTTMSDGTRVWSTSAGQPTQELKGAIAEQGMLEHPGRLFGDWRAHFASVEVLGRCEREGVRLLQVWCTPLAAPSTLLFIDEASGRVVGSDRVVTVPGVGPVGVSTVFSDFRAITSAGRTITLPFKASGEFASAMLGNATTEISACRTPKAIPAERFQPEAPTPKP